MSKPTIDFVLLWKKLFGSLTPREEKRLSRWLKADNQNQIYFEKLKAFQGNPEKISIDQQQAAWLKLQTKMGHPPATSPIATHGNPHRYLYRVAAILLVTLMAGLYIKDQYFTHAKLQPVAITPGTRKAILITETGQSITLGDSTIRIHQQGVQTAASQTGVTYTAAATPLPGPQGTATTTPQAAINTLIIPRGGEFNLTLADGTRVWLNAESKLQYPVQFNGPVRSVQLSGQAYFEVTNDPAHPFEVVTHEQTVSVLGTAFDVMAYPDEAHIVTTLVSGKVNVHLASGKSVHLLPQEQAIFDINAGTLAAHPVTNLERYTSWKDGIFIFEDEPLGNIMNKLARWYDFSISYEKGRLSHDQFTAHIDKYQPLTEVLKLIEITDEVAFTIQGRTIVAH